MHTSITITSPSHTHLMLLSHHNFQEDSDYVPGDESEDEDESLADSKDEQSGTTSDTSKDDYDDDEEEVDDSE